MMTNVKTNQSIKYLISFLVAIMMIITCTLSVNAAGKEYKISFKVGSKGSLQSGETSINQMVAANGSLQLTPDTIAAMLEIEPGYYFNGWNYPVQMDNITESANYVAQYRRIVDEAVYRVSYVDNFGNQLATPKVVTSNVGIVVAENALNIEGYAADQLTKTVEVAKEGTEIVFTYVSTLEGNVETIVVNEVVVIAGTGTGGTTGTGTGTGTTADGQATGTDETAGAGTGQGNEAGGENSQVETEEVPEDQTPLAEGDKQNSENSDNGLLIGGSILGVIVIAGIIYLVVKRK